MKVQRNIEKERFSLVLWYQSLLRMRGIVIDLNDEHLHPLAEMQDFLNEPWHVDRAARGWRANGAESDGLPPSISAGLRGGVVLVV